MNSIPSSNVDVVVVLLLGLSFTVVTSGHAVKCRYLLN